VNVVPADATLAELEQRAAACEERSEQASEPAATLLQEEAKLLREWIAVLWGQTKVDLVILVRVPGSLAKALTHE